MAHPLNEMVPVPRPSMEMPSGRVALRALAPTDAALLRDYLYLALFVPEGQPPLPASILSSPGIARYVAGWGRIGDSGILAYDTRTGRDLGAAWLRLWQADEPGYGFVDDTTPELSIAVRPGRRGCGVGTLMLKRLLAEADRSGTTVSLSVSDANPAVRLYERFGFVPLTSSEGSTTMCRLPGTRGTADGMRPRPTAPSED